ncbi:MAG: hypothetical protein FJ086_09575 [Deltaproteobacteria bacterium]|nr:hypothetical protein [Deltaproteobacteria bacterium]
MSKISQSPSPATFADAWAKQFEKSVKKVAGEDGRLSVNEAKKLAETTGAGKAFADEAMDFFQRTGQQTVSVPKLVSTLRGQVEATAKKAAGADGRLSAADMAKLPKHLQADVAVLKGELGAAKPSLQTQLASLTKGLLNVSESESPVFAVSGGKIGSAPITPELVAQKLTPAFNQHALAMSGGERLSEQRPLVQQPVDERSVVNFLSHRTNVGGFQDAETQQWGRVANKMTAELSDLKLYAFGEIEVTLVLVGRSKSGELVGIMAGSIET